MSDDQEKRIKDLEKHVEEIEENIDLLIESQESFIKLLVMMTKNKENHADSD